MPPVIDKNNCVHCDKCVDICSEDVFYGSEPKSIPVVNYPDECWHCSACVSTCPVENAISIRVPLPMMLLYKPSE